jgi:trimeric autotransporter adhesin
MKFLYTLLVILIPFKIFGQHVRYLEGLPQLPIGSGLSFALRSSAIALGDRFVFVTQDKYENYELWITDGSAEGTFKLIDLNGNAASYPAGLIEFNNRVFFTAYDGAYGRELWTTDGTTRGTKILKDIMPGANSSYPVRLTKIGSKLIFIADDGVYGRELWETDGTTEGTKLLKDVNPNGDSYWSTGDVTNDKPFPINDGKAYFTGYTSSVQNGTGSLFETDGTAIGTTAIMTNVKVWSLVSFIPFVENKTLFTISKPDNLDEIWLMDKTTDANNPVLTQVFSRLGAQPEQFSKVGDKMYFTAITVNNIRVLMQTDGTVATEVSNFPYGHVHYTNSINGKLFVLGASENGLEIALSDGTASGTEVLNTTVGGSQFDPRAILNNKLFYKREGEDLSASLWATDGTTNERIKTFDGNSNIYSIHVMNGQLFLIVERGYELTEVWRSDGTAENTRLVRSIGPGRLEKRPMFITSGTDNFLFTAVDAAGDEFWFSDGTPEGTRCVGDLDIGQSTSAMTSYGMLDGMFENKMIVNGAAYEFYLWDSETETSSLIMDKKIVTSYYDDITATSDKIFFRVEDLQDSKCELWVYDGATGQRSKIFEDIYISRNNARHKNNVVFYSTNNETSTRGLYATDGVSVTPIWDMAQNTGMFKVITTVDDKSYFISRNDNATHIYELWELDGTASGTKWVRNLDPTVAFVQAIENELFFVSFVNNKPNLWSFNVKTQQVSQIATLSTSNWTQNSISFNERSLKLNGKFYFFFNDYPQSRTLIYESDGSPAGTHFVGSFAGFTQTYNMQASAPYIYFEVHSNTYGTELWRSDGTIAGTRIIKDISPGPAHSFQSIEIGVLDGKAFFGATVGSSFYYPQSHETEIWMTDGTEENTKTLSSLGLPVYRGPWYVLSRPDRVYVRIAGEINVGVAEIFFNSSGLDVSFENDKVANHQRIQWGHTQTNVPLDGVLSIKNTGDQNLIIDDISFGNTLFSLTTEIAGTTVNPGETKNFVLRFLSGTSGLNASDVIIRSNVKRSPEFTFQLRAAATAPASVVVVSEKASMEYCADEEKSFTAEAVNPGKYPSYDWYAANKLIKTTTEPVATFATAITANTSLKVVLIPSEDAASTEATASSNVLSLIVHPVSETIVQISSDIPNGPLEKNTPVTFTAAITHGGNDPVLQWLINNVPVEGANSNVFVTDDLVSNDVIVLHVTPGVACPLNDLVISNAITAPDVITGIDEFTSAVVLHPNPANESFTIESPYPTRSVHLMDMHGKLVAGFHQNFVYETAAIKPGIYLVRIDLGNRTIYKKLAISR